MGNNQTEEHLARIASALESIDTELTLIFITLALTFVVVVFKM